MVSPILRYHNNHSWPSEYNQCLFSLRLVPSRIPYFGLPLDKHIGGKEVLWTMT